MKSENSFSRHLFNDTVYMNFRVCFTINNIFSLCETYYAFIHVFCHSKINFHQRGLLKLIKTMLKSFLALFYLRYGLGIKMVITRQGLPSVQYSQMMKLKIKLQTMSVSVPFSRQFPLLEIIEQEGIIKTLILCDFTI